MKSYLPLLIGGLAPAFLWGRHGRIPKYSATASLGSGRYLVAFGIIIACVGATYAHLTSESHGTLRGVAFALAAGATFAIGTGLLSFALLNFDLPISRVAPLLSSNVVVPVFVGIIFLAKVLAPTWRNSLLAQR